MKVRRGNLFDLATWETEFKYDVVMLMPGRLIENEEKERNEYLINLLKLKADRVLLYAYGDWLKRFNGLAGLVQAAGLGTHEVEVIRGPGAEALLIKTADIPVAAEAATP